MNIDLSTIEAITTASNTRITWSLSLFGGTLVVLLSNSYPRPENFWIKLIYLLFLPAWYYLGKCIYLGDVMARRAIIATIRTENVAIIENIINDEFAAQLYNFNIALCFLATWLVCYLLLWVFSKSFHKK